METVSFTLFSWAVGILVVVLAGFVKAVMVVHRRVTKRKEELAEYKLEVSEKYVSVGHLQEVEKRLTTHLLRIEEKLGEYLKQ